jgi:hypothetical protein
MEWMLLVLECVHVIAGISREKSILDLTGYNALLSNVRRIHHVPCLRSLTSIRSQETHKCSNAQAQIKYHVIASSTQLSSSQLQQHGMVHRETLSNPRNMILFLVAAYDAFSRERHDSAAQLIAELDATNEIHNSESKRCMYRSRNYLEKCVRR